jgi:miniconductance mechanosensitive channel
MGAMTAILLLFKDTILGFVASIQMSVWYGACRRLDCHAKNMIDGLVMSINLSTVKVQTGIKPSLRFLPMHL